VDKGIRPGKIWPGMLIKREPTKHGRIQFHLLVFLPLQVDGEFVVERAISAVVAVLGPRGGVYHLLEFRSATRVYLSHAFIPCGAPPAAHISRCILELIRSNRSPARDECHGHMDTGQSRRTSWRAYHCCWQSGCLAC